MAVRTSWTAGDVLTAADLTDTFAAKIGSAIVDAKGDLIAGTAADTVSRLAVGTNGQVLTADSSTATGLKWGPAGAVSLVASSTFTTSSSVIVSGLSTSFHNYRLVVDFSASSAQQMVFLRNRASGTSNASSYRTETVEQYGSTISAAQNIGGDGTKWTVGRAENTYPTLCGFVLDLINSSQTQAKSMFARSFHMTNGAVSVQMIHAGYHDWGTAADAIELFFGSGGTASGTVRLYGYNAS